MSDTKFYELVHPGGPGGLVLRKPRMRKQAKRFKAVEFYAAVFFPKITGIGNAHGWHLIDTLSQTPEAAKAKYLDGICKGETWATYEDAGWKIRKVKISDLGDPEPPETA